MLKNMSSIKLAIRDLKIMSVLALACFSRIGNAQTPTTPSPQMQTDSTPPGLSFLASARLKSPDRTDEVSTAEVKVNLDGSKTITLKGRTLNVTLESEPSSFSKTQLVRVSASGSAGPRGGSTSFYAGTFKVADSNQHNFLFMEKTRGWLLEVKLRPIEIVKPKNLQQEPSKSQSPARVPTSRKPRRLPA
ncbi:hypothetical protein EBR21_11825 [bacterium]|nr:hypothetical protein [bacterium]